MYDVKVYNQENKLVVVFGCERVATVAPGNMVAQYPALGKFVDCFILGDSDVYEYSAGKVIVTEK